MSTWRRIDIFFRLGIIMVLVIVGSLALNSEMSTEIFMYILLICMVLSFLVSSIIAFLFKEKKAGWGNVIGGVFTILFIRYWFY